MILGLLPRRRRGEVVHRMRCHDYDVLVAADFRHGGGTTASIAQEVEVQARMGLRTGLIQVDAPHLVDGPWAERIRSVVAAGLAEVVSARNAARARLLVLRQPRGFGHAGWSLSARADRVLFVANQVPDDGARRKPYYVVSDVGRRLAEELGVEPLWAPIGPVVREALRSSGTPSVALSARDWINVIDAEAWAPRGSRSFKTPLVIGRHSRDDVKKWPERGADLFGAYPDSNSPLVRVLGGASAVRQRVGFVSRHWEVHEFGSISAEAFLAGLDVYVYFHASRMREAFGRGVLEALASGLPVVTHPYLEPLFGDACVYSEPRAVPERLRDLLANPASCTNHRGVALVRERYDWEEHRRRLGEFFEHPLPPISRQRTSKPRVLWVNLNAGRPTHSPPTAALVSELRSDHESLVLTQSLEEWAALRDQHLWVDYLPPRHSTGLNAEQWLRYASQRLALAVRVFRPATTVFVDAPVEQSLLDAVARFPGVRLVHCRTAACPAPCSPGVAERDREPAFDLELDCVDSTSWHSAAGESGERSSSWHGAERAARLLRELEDSAVRPVCGRPVVPGGRPVFSYYRAVGLAVSYAVFARPWRTLAYRLSGYARKHNVFILRREPNAPELLAPKQVLVAPDDVASAQAELHRLGCHWGGNGPCALALISAEFVPALGQTDLAFEVLPEPPKGEISQRLLLSLYGLAKTKAIADAHPGRLVLLRAYGDKAAMDPLQYWFGPEPD